MSDRPKLDPVTLRYAAERVYTLSAELRGHHYSYSRARDLAAALMSMAATEEKRSHE